MAFKIKDGVRIGTVDVFDNTGTLLVPAPKWQNSRTVTFAGGDVTGSFSIDGSADVNNIALTIAANSVELGTDTTGNYVATVGAGTPGAETSSSGLTISAAAGEGTAATIAHANTSDQASVSVTGNNFINSISLDGFGHITAIGTGSVTITETDTLQTVTTRGATSDVATISLTGGTASTTTGTGTLVVTGGVGISGALNVGGAATVGGNLTVTGDLAVNGTLTTINSTTVTVDDKNIELGSVATPTDTTADGGGITLKGASDKTILWVQSTGRWTFNNPIEATSIQNTPIGSTTASTGAFTTLSASGNVTLNGAGATLSLQPSGAGTVTINPATAGTINNMSIGATARGSGAFTTLTSNAATTFTANTASTSTGTGTVVVTGGVGVSGAIYAGSIQNTPIGSTTASSGAFTTLSATGAVTVNTAANNQSYTTTGAGTITITSNTTGNINGMNIGATTRGSGAFTTLAASSAVTFASATNATSNSTGAVQIDGGMSVDLDIYHSGSHVYATAAGVKVGEERALQTTVATTSATALDSWAVATYRYARYIVQITQGSDIQISEVRLAHNGTTTTMTEYAVLETNGPIAAAFTSDVTGGNARLLVTMTSATSATINIIRTLVVV